jgi:hypothetical protein
MPTIEPTIRRRSCKKCETLYVEPFPYENSWPKGYCSEDCYKAKKRAEAPTPRRTQGLVTKPSKAKRQAISPASPAQRAKKAAGASIVSGAVTGLDPAHICPRDLGGCDEHLCVVPLTREEHEAFDNADPRTGKRLDILPYLIAHGCVDELAHALEHYRGDLIALLERVTGEKWEPCS